MSVINEVSYEESKVDEIHPDQRRHSFLKHVNRLNNIQSVQYGQGHIAEDFSSNPKTEIPVQGVCLDRL